MSNCPYCGHQTHFLLQSTDFTLSQEKFEIWACSHCQGAYTKNAPQAHQIAPYYASPDYISHSDTQKGLINQLYHVARRLMLALKTNLVEKYNRDMPKNILDIGTGTGYFLHALQEKNWQTLGIEPDPKARDFAIKNFALEVLPAENFWELQTHFQVISLWHVLEHLHDLDKYWLKIKALLAPKGTLFIAVPNLWASERQHYGQFWAAWDTPRHLWHLSPKTMQFLAQKFGFRIVEQKIMPFDPFYIALLSEKYKKSMGAFPKGIFFGGISFLKSLVDKQKASSIIYVLQHN